MKLASIRKFRDEVCRYAKKGEFVFITNHGTITGCFLPLQHTEEVPIEVKKELITVLGRQIAASLTTQKITEKEILDDFKAFKKARRRQ